MFTNSQPPRIPLPKGWQGCVKSAGIYAFSLARYCIVYARARAADSINARVRLAAQNDRLHEECALLREELRIKDARTAQFPPQRRPHYGPLERTAILELRAVRGWSLKTSESVQRFLESAIETSTTPKYIICDKGKQFWCDMFKDGVIATGSHPASAPSASTGVLRLLNDSS